MEPNNRSDTVIISVRGGVAEVEYCPNNMNVVIIDYDNIKDDPDYCPVCHEDISDNETGLCDGCGFDLNGNWQDGIDVEEILGE
jgi:hypothetical protein